MSIVNASQNDSNDTDTYRPELDVKSQTLLTQQSGHSNHIVTPTTHHMENHDHHPELEPTIITNKDSDRRQVEASHSNADSLPQSTLSDRPDNDDNATDDGTPSVNPQRLSTNPGTAQQQPNVPCQSSNTSWQETDPDMLFSGLQQVMPRPLPRQLFVGNLPFRVRWQDLKDLFRQAGPILRADVALGPDHRSKGHGTVLFASFESAKQAIDMFNRFEWQGRILEVREDRGYIDPLAQSWQADFSNPKLSDLPEGVGGRSAGRLEVLSDDFGGMLHQMSVLRPTSDPRLASTGQGPTLISQLPFGADHPKGDGLDTSLSSYPLTNPRYANDFPPVESHNQQGALDNPLASLNHQNYLYYGGMENPLMSMQNQGSMGRQLFVGNLSFNIQWQDLKDLFRNAGNILRADIAHAPDGRSRGFGTVLYATVADALNAIAMYDGYEFHGRPLRVRMDKYASTSNKSGGGGNTSQVFNSGLMYGSSSFMMPSAATGQLGTFGADQLFGLPNDMNFGVRTTLGQGFAERLPFSMPNVDVNQGESSSDLYGGAQAFGHEGLFGHEPLDALSLQRLGYSVGSSGLHPAALGMYASLGIDQPDAGDGPSAYDDEQNAEDNRTDSEWLGISRTHPSTSDLGSVTSFGGSTNSAQSKLAEALSEELLTHRPSSPFLKRRQQHLSNSLPGLSSLNSLQSRDTSQHDPATALLSHSGALPSTASLSPVSSVGSGYRSTRPPPPAAGSIGSGLAVGSGASTIPRQPSPRPASPLFQPYSRGSSTNAHGQRNGKQPQGLPNLSLSHLASSIGSLSLQSSYSGSELDDGGEDGANDADRTASTYGKVWGLDQGKSDGQSS